MSAAKQDCERGKHQKAHEEGIIGKVCIAWGKAEEGGKLGDDYLDGEQDQQRFCGIGLHRLFDEPEHGTLAVQRYQGGFIRGKQVLQFSLHGLLLLQLCGALAFLPFFYQCSHTFPPLGSLP
ncbi:hypothetical protein SDC9_86267 [bioreactor metagenome]|uniref:Uncharacterized protein n=1 Tax=bioreactor metagenome TaxID=1076179 RepID=A0A644ZLR1_9ZZZZ